MKKNKNLISFLIVLVVTGLVLYFALKDQAGEIFKQIISINLPWLLLAVLLMFGYTLFRSFSFSIFVRKFNKDYTVGRALNLTLKTQFYNAITPFATGGQPFQVYELKKEGVSYANSTNVIVQNFIAYQISIIVLGIISLVCNRIFNIFTNIGIVKQFITIGFIINAGIAVMLLIMAFTKTINHKVVKGIIRFLACLKIVKNKQETINKWENYIEELYEGGQVILKDKKSFFKCIFLNFLSHLCSFSIPAVLLYGTGNFTSFNAGLAIITNALIYIMSSFVPIPGGTGGMEYGFIILFGTFIDDYTLHTIMILWRFITYYLLMIIGFIVVNADKGGKYVKINRRQLKNVFRFKKRQKLFGRN